MKALEYPFDSQWILKKKKSIKRTLLSENRDFIKKKIAVLGGSTTHDIVKVLELFLLDQGIQAEFYESEYNQYYQDAMFPNETLKNFQPDFIYLHTTNRNITAYPMRQRSGLRGNTGGLRPCGSAWRTSITVR